MTPTSAPTTSSDIRGSIVAIVTPMHDDGSLDIPRYRQLIDWHIEQGTDAIVAVGTTGESATVTPEEHCQLIQIAVEQSGTHGDKRIPIIAGTGGNSTAEAIELTQFAKSVGADASLSVVPYYNKPTQEGMYQHFKKIAESVDLPMIVYNVPGRTVADMSNATTLRLAHIDNIVGIKDATANIDRGISLLAAIEAQSLDFALYSGDDATAITLMLLGGAGNISVTANVAPNIMRRMCAAAMQGDIATAKALHCQLLALHHDLFIEANPIPVKWALHRMGKIGGALRLPLTELSVEAQVVMTAALSACKLI
jgi:4-hydroxy-tetrahydrodipicolinate synthase